MTADSPQASTIVLRELAPGEDPTPFRLLNEEWITRFFTLEPRDREVLSDPGAHILALGGHIYFADLEGRTVGTVALIPMMDDPATHELSKMAVSPAAQGRGIGRLLLTHAIAEARRLRARSLFLLSSSRLANAVHLYESVGFRHIPKDQLPASLYSRADVFMDLTL